MEVFLSDDSVFDDTSIDAAVDLKISLEFVTHSLPKKTQEYMSLLLSKYLEECGMSKYYSKLNFCLSEILFNAVKANVKRIYFEEKGLDINKAGDYEFGMRTFRQETLKNKDYYFQKLRESDLYVKYSLKVEDDILIIEVKNNSLMTASEALRVSEKISGCHIITPEEFSGFVIDESEGAGLGINTIILTLKSFGLPGDNFKIFTSETETIARLVIENPSELPGVSDTDADTVDELEDLEEI